MNMSSDKKGALKTVKVEQYIMLFVLVMILFKVIAQLFPDVTDSAQELNDSGFPLASFFLADGVLWYLVGAGLLFMIYKSFSSSK